MLIEYYPEPFDVDMLPPDILTTIEADSYWCLTKLLDGIQVSVLFRHVK